MKICGSVVFAGYSKVNNWIYISFFFTWIIHTIPCALGLPLRSQYWVIWSLICDDGGGHIWGLSSSLLPARCHQHIWGGCAHRVIFSAFILSCVDVIVVVCRCLKLRRLLNAFHEGIECAKCFCLPGKYKIETSPDIWLLLSYCAIKMVGVRVVKSDEKHVLVVVWRRYDRVETESGTVNVRWHEFCGQSGCSPQGILKKTNCVRLFLCEARPEVRL